MFRTFCRRPSWPICDIKPPHHCSHSLMILIALLSKCSNSPGERDLKTCRRKRWNLCHLMFIRVSSFSTTEKRRFGMGRERIGIKGAERRKTRKRQRAKQWKWGAQINLFKFSLGAQWYWRLCSSWTAKRLESLFGCCSWRLTTFLLIVDTIKREKRMKRDQKSFVFLLRLPQTISTGGFPLTSFVQNRRWWWFCVTERREKVETLNWTLWSLQIYSGRFSSVKAAFISYSSLYDGENFGNVCPNFFGIWEKSQDFSDMKIHVRRKLFAGAFCVAMFTHESKIENLSRDIEWEWGRVEICESWHIPTMKLHEN